MSEPCEACKAIQRSILETYGDVMKMAAARDLQQKAILQRILDEGRIEQGALREAIVAAIGPKEEKG